MLWKNRRVSWKLLPLLIAFGAGCGSFSSDPDDLVVAYRFIEDDPTQRLDLSPEARQSLDADELWSRAWKAELADELRNVLPAVPGHVIERLVRLPERAELHFALAVEPRVQVPVRFRVSVEPAPGGRRYVFDQEVPAGNSGQLNGEPSASWRQAEVDLSTFGGKELWLRLEVQASEKFDAARGLAFWGHPEILRPRSETPAPNIVLISIDTLRADRLSLYGNPRPTSPNIDRWARRSGAIFRHAVAQAPWTMPSHYSILSGVNAHRHSLHHLHDTRFAGRLEMLAEILRQQGYATVGITGGGYVRPELGFDQGFDVYRYWASKQEWDSELRTNLRHALSWIDRLRQRPFFLFFHTYEVHGPHSARQPYFDRFSEHDSNLRLGIKREGLEEGPLRAKKYLLIQDDGSRVALPAELASLPKDLYDSRVAFADAELARLLSRLQEPDLKNRTIVVLTSDHGELLGEHDAAGHEHFFEENLLVPLVIATPAGIGAGTFIDKQVRSIDILPTLMELSGLEAADDIDGVSLLPIMAGQDDEIPPEAWSYSTGRGYSLRLRNRFKYTFWEYPWAPYQGTEALYDLQRDPQEGQDLARTSSAVVLPLRQMVRLAIEDSAGLRVRFENSEPVAFSGILQGEIINYQIKTADLRCDCVTYVDSKKLTFRLPPGERFTLILPQGSPRAESLRLSLTFDNEARSHQTTIDLQAVETVEAVAWNGSAWTHGEPQPGSMTGLSFWFQGESATSDSPADTDEDLKRQLRALGYLN
jgi:arylsulfatase A-like enzyme